MRWCEQVTSDGLISAWLIFVLNIGLYPHELDALVAVV